MAAIQQAPAPDDAEPQIKAGTIINEWKMTKMIGSGVFGAVFECKRADQNNQDKNSYAMKVGF